MQELHKRHHIVTKVGATKDSKQIFQLVENLLGKKEDNPLPDATSDSAPAEDFAIVFPDKIDNICTRFEDIEP